MEKNSVSVWIACKESFDAWLFVGPALGGNSQPLDITNSLNQLTPNPPLVKSIPFGAKLHVALVTTPVTNPLVPGVIYQYNLKLKTPSSSAKWLGEAKVLSSGTGLGPISYGNLPGPTFVMPAATPGGLKFAHASCRKPHGGKLDALAALHSVLMTTRSDPVERPQQLFLTGDQVYTDDVHPALLHMLMDASKTLLQLQVQEDLAFAGKEYLPLKPLGVDKRSPGNRLNTLKNHTTLTTDDGHNHLFYLGEFYTMYLFAWSDTLWPAAASLPAFHEALPGNSAKTLKMERGEFPRMSTSQTDSDAYIAYQAGLAALERFLQDLPQVRKVLANIACYMMFDDHEATDDWFFDREWCKGALTFGSMSRRVLQNALASYAVFQAWGNTPAAFVPGSKGDALFNLLVQLTMSTAVELDWSKVGVALLPTVGQQSGNLEPSTGAPFWHFDINFGSYQLVVLDTRTHRGFDGPKGAPRLIAAQHLAKQLPARAGNTFTLVVSPAPVVGHIPTELFFEQVLYGFLSDPDLDYEAWTYNKNGFESIIQALAKYKYVVILSGDVHYSFSTQTYYWNEQNVADKEAVFVQLCASAAKNTNPKADFAGNRATSHIKETSWLDYGYVCDRNTPELKIWRISGAAWRNVNGPPSWQYRVLIAKDGRPQYGPNSRGFTAPVAGLSGAAGRMQRQRLKIEQGHKVVVSQDNIGLVSFDWGATPHLVHHDLLWSPVGDDPKHAPPPAAHTRHSMPLQMPPPSMKPVP